MASDEKWYFTKEQLENTPSRQCGIDWFKELFYRQQAAYFIQDMGQRLRVSQLCINTATVYMHRFYVFHSFSHFPWYSIAAAALFLAAKVEEQPRKLEHVIRVHNLCKNPRETAFDVNSERYLQQSQDLVFNENILLQTLGFDVAIDHPHAHVVRCCHLVRASKDLAQTSYFMASTSLHLTTMCLQYKPTVVACFCIHLACKWSNWEIPLSNEKKEWYSYVDPTVTDELLQQLTEEFLKIYERCPQRIKEKIMAIGEGASITRTTSHVSSPFDSEPRKLHPPTDMRDPHHRLHHHEKAGADRAEDPHKHRSNRLPHESSTSSSQQRENEYREKKEQDRRAQHPSSKPPMGAPLSSSAKPNIPYGHHRPVDPKMKPPSRPPSVGHLTSSSRNDHREILRETVCDIGIRDPHRETVRVSDFNDSKDLHNRSDKEIDKRAYSHSASESNSLNSIDHGHFSVDKRPETSRSRLAPDPKLMQHKHESSRRHDDLKQPADIKKHPSMHYDNKNLSSSHLKPGVMSTSQKTKSPYPPETSKSVPIKTIKKEPIDDINNIKIESHNGHSSNGSYSLPSFNDVEMLNVKIKEEPLIPPTITKKPSMFSPEKTPPRKQQGLSKRAFESVSHQEIPTSVSSMDCSIDNRRSRTVSNSSEPELRPVMKKIDQVEGFENLLRDSTIGIKSEVPDKYSSENRQQLKIIKEEIDNNSNGVISSNGLLSGSVPLSQPIVNGLETNPTVISNLLKQAPSVPHLPTITKNVPDELLVTKEKEHHHKDKKKKNKEKHKHKDKDKSREEKEKKKKHKEKDRDKHKSKNKDKDKQEEMQTQPIKITISKDKIHPPETQSIGIKIKIPKDRIKTDVIGEASTQNPGIKIKIPKDVMNNMSSESKKRDRDKHSGSDGPPLKVSKSNYARQHGEKQNGRNSFGKVAHMGDGDTSMHRMAESKYSKGAST